MEPFIIESGEARDYGELVAFWAANDTALGPTDVPELLAACVAREPDLLFTAYEDASRSSIAGLAWGTFDGRRGYVNHLAVRRDLRGRGLGSALMRALMARFAQRGVYKVHLFVMKGNEGVIGLYRSLGFKVRDDLTLMSGTPSPSS